MKCAQEGCDKQARKKFCSEDCKHKFHNALNKGRVPLPKKVRKHPVVESFRW